MRTYKEIADEIRSLQDSRQEIDRKLYEEMSAARAVEIEEAAKEDAKAGRTNSCIPRYGDKQTAWQVGENGRLRCSFCGSIHPQEAIELLKTPDTYFSGSDWKYGWPHKFYIGNGKLYCRHLRDATPEQFKEFAKLSMEIFNITWELKEDGLHWSAPKTDSFYGYQRAGYIRENGKIEHQF